MKKHFIGPEELLEDAYRLAWKVFKSGFFPTYIIGIWRGGAPLAIAVHELLCFLGVNAKHTPIKISSYDGLTRGDEITINGLAPLCEMITKNDSLLVVDDVHDTGHSIEHLLTNIKTMLISSKPEIRVATAYFKPNRNETGKEPDYFLHKNNDWLVFPHELEGLSLDELKIQKPALSKILPGIKEHFNKNTFS